MGVPSLPLELQQQVFSYLDTKAFYAARNVCRWWRFASLDALTLSRQLRKLPILPPIDTLTSSPSELQQLFNEAAYTLMLGMRVTGERDAAETPFEAARLSTPSPRVTATTNGGRTVTLNGRDIALFDTSERRPSLLAQRSIIGLRESASNTSYHELALSSDGSLLAIAQERTIQIYDLFGERDSCTVNEYIASATDHYICGLDFEQGDHVLRVRLSGKGSVLYLGSPPAQRSNKSASIQHWKGNAGLKYTFLDTSLLSAEAQSGSEDYTARLSGLQLLRPFHDGYVFASQKHGGNESSHYILGYIKCSIYSHNACALTADTDTVVVLSRLETYLSAWDYVLNSIADSGVGLWENMPSAHEHHPRFALSPDSTHLALAERDKKCIRPKHLTQLFVYRLPGEVQMQKTLEEHEQRRRGRGSKSAGFLDKLDRAGRQSDRMETDIPNRESPKEHNVGRLPICLATIQGDINGICYSEIKSERGSRALVLSASTAESTRRWRFIAM